MQGGVRSAVTAVTLWVGVVPVPASILGLVLEVGSHLEEVGMRPSIQHVCLLAVRAQRVFLDA